MTTRVDYDTVAPDYGRRYEKHDFRGVRDALLAFTDGATAVLEVGCGTGHWLTELAGRSPLVAGVDYSAGMLARAQASASTALLARATAEALPVRSESIDRVVCINALHHFFDARAFAREASRVLRGGGGVLVIGLDPHTERDRWWIYDYFPSALSTDLARYPSVSLLQSMLAEAGFADTESWEVQHVPAARAVTAAAAQGLLERSSTSQLMVISDDEYRAGIARIRAEAAAAAEAGAPEPVLRSDLRLYATTGWRRR